MYFHCDLKFVGNYTLHLIFLCEWLISSFSSSESANRCSLKVYYIIKADNTSFNYVFVGRKYNKDGDLVNWWSNSSNEAFENKSQCFIKQYSSFEAYGKKVRNFTNSRAN